MRKFALDKHKSVDDTPYGGGPGMLLKPDVIVSAIESVKTKSLNFNKKKPFKIKEKTVLCDPTGKIFNQKKARDFAKIDHLIIVCGHYEGFDARVSYFVDEKISVGKYILTGGEIPAMIITDATVRLIPRVLTNPEATLNESFSTDYNQEPPQYTRPVNFRGLKVPQVLLSGNHQLIEKWRKQHSKLNTNKLGQKKLLK